MADDAPLYTALARGPEGGRAWWLHADDGVRLRVAHWPGTGRGTVYLLPGRAEHVEKYGLTAAAVTAMGFDVVTLDWRGQGLADRLLADPTVGHVERFSDYQRDLEATVAHGHALGLPEPAYMIAHSMGGCIGLRALHRGLPFRAVLFTGPLWGVAAKPHLRLAGWILSTAAQAVGQASGRVPATAAESYVLAADFEDNMLTTDREMWDYLRDQITGIDGIALAGPSLTWLSEALQETRRLRRLGPARQPCVTVLGGNDRVISARAVRSIMARWKNGRLEEMPGLEHEVLIERPEARAHVMALADALFA